MNREIKLNNTNILDLEILLNTRLLVQANSGGGKSWLLRRILEQSHGKVQQIIIDLEGEFSTLREKYDYILVSKDGDIQADPRNAALLARKLLELNVSAIIDLYELHEHERKHFVKLFLDSMVNAPKELWHNCLIVIDEAHVLAPEKGQGESEASQAVSDLLTRGRKRGYCGIIATQRLSMLSKNVAAQCNNMLIGYTGLDTDMKRAAYQIGFTKKDEHYLLRQLEPGEFFAYGPAISKEVIKIKIGEVKTTHIDIGSHISLKTTPPTSKIKAILKKLGNLPEEAKKELNTITELKTEITTLRRHRCPKVNTKEDIDEAVKIALQKKDREFYQERTKWQKQIENFFSVIEQIGKITQKALKDNSSKKFIVSKPVPLSQNKPIRIKSLPVNYSANKPTKEKEFIISNMELPPLDDEKSLTGGALRMLEVLVSRHPMKLTKVQLATFARLKSSSGTFGTYLSLLRSRELIELESGFFSATQLGIDYIGVENINPPQTSDEVIAQWQKILKGGARRMFDVLITQYPAGLGKEELGEITGLVSTSGTFNTYLSMLKSNDLIEVSDNEIKISENLFI